MDAIKKVLVFSFILINIYLKVITIFNREKVNTSSKYSFAINTESFTAILLWSNITVGISYYWYIINYWLEFIMYPKKSLIVSNLKLSKKLFY